MGTALGDFLADKSGLSFASGAILIESLFVIIVLVSICTHQTIRNNLGNLLTKTLEKGGLNFGTAGFSLILLIRHVVLVCTSIIKIKRETKTDCQKNTLPALFFCSYTQIFSYHYKNNYQ